MLDLAGLALAALVSRRELRFDPVPEQWAPEACGLAVAAALGAEPPVLRPSVQTDGSEVASRPGSAGLVSLGELAGLLAKGGIAVAPRRLGLAEFDEALDRGFSPIVLHYNKPDPHWALLVGKGPWGYGVGDPARGFELLEKEELAARASGAVILVDPSTLSEGKKEGLLRAFDRAEARAEFLSTLAGGGAKERMEEAEAARTAETAEAVESGRSIGLESRLALAERGGTDAMAASLGLRFSEDSGLSLGAGMVFAARGGLFSLWPRMDFTGTLNGGRRFITLGLAIGDDETEYLLRSDRQAYDPVRPIINLAAGLILDPLLFALSLDAAPALAGGWEPWIRLSLSAIEAINENCSLEVLCAYASDLGEGESTLALSLTFGFRAEAWRGNFGWLESGNDRALLIGGEARARLE